MGTNVERIERYLRGVAVPKCVSERHRQHLRRRILGEIGNRRTVPLPGRTWKIAVAAVVLVCLGGAVGTFIDMNYRSTGEPAGSVERLVGEDAREGYTLSTPVPDTNGVLAAMPTAKEPEEAGLLPEQGEIETVMVGASGDSPVQMIEVETSGRSDNRAPLRYAVAKGGRTVIGVNTRSPLPTSLSPADWVELSQLREAGKGEELGTQERQLKGRAFVFQRARYTLRDGTRVIVSVGTPKKAQQGKEPE